MAGLPDITIAGTLVADPELRITPTGTAVANFTVAANDRRYDKDSGQWVDKGATFLRCTLWRQAAENLAQSLTKGTRVLEAYAKTSLKKYRPIAARNEDKKVFNGLL